MASNEEVQTEEHDTQSDQKRYCYKYPRPALAVDIALFTFAQEKLQLLLIQRKADPFKKEWALPGGFMEIDETPAQAAQRELREETGVRNAYIEQLRAFGDPERDPRTRVVSIAYLALIATDKLAQSPVLAADDADDARWWSSHALPRMAFDHADIVGCALERVRTQLASSSLALHLLPEEFTLSNLQRLHEAILDERLDKRNFRRKVLDMEILEETGNLARGGHRPARLYRAKHSR
jgi:8-oxo-dGTP diphosphatase